MGNALHVLNYIIPIGTKLMVFWVHVRLIITDILFIYLFMCAFVQDNR